MNTGTQGVTEIRDMFEAGIYFKNRRGLRISRFFEARVLSGNREPIPYCKSRGVESVVINRGMEDTDILMECLGGWREVHEYPFPLIQIASMIDAQQQGEEGDLLIDGANVFFTLGERKMLFPVSLCWEVASSEWLVNSWNFAVNGFRPPGTKIFRNIGYLVL